MNKAMAPGKRARTRQQKSDRRTAILLTAERQFRETGFEGFSMAVLARDAGVAKGTLYLYFHTREEVLLAIYNDQLAAWCDDLLKAVDVGISDRHFVEAFFRTIRRDPVFLQLTARLDSVIEHNVSMDALVESKRLMLAQIARVSPRLETCLDLSPEQAFEVLAGFSALMLGAQQADSGPSLEGETLPPEVRTLTERFAAERIFVPNACRMLAGIRNS